MKNIEKRLVIVLIILSSFLGKATAQPAYNTKEMKMEKLNRGVVAIKKNNKSNFISWRYLSSDPIDTAFDIYRNNEKINKTPIVNSTCYTDHFKSNDPVTYTIKSIKETDEASYTMPANAPVGYIDIPLDKPLSGITPDGQMYHYLPNDASIGDVDGDGEYEIILKWDPSNAHDNSHRGYTGNVYIDCYKLNGKKLWRIDLGKNIRAGAHYTQFMVYDLDGDGKAEVVMKTADGTIDGEGNIIGDPKLDHRNENGFILKGDEFLTIFNGETGKAMQAIHYNPPRGGSMVWGDDKGNRVDRFLACVAYLDGINPSVVMCRGYYARTVLVAYDWKDGQLTERWMFDSNTPGNEDYAGQGNHNLRVGDVDGDGYDEIVYGSCTIDHDGTGLYSTKMGHGDAMHLTVIDPSREGLQVWDCHENKRDGTSLRDAATGEVLFQIPAKEDVGRCMTADIDPDHPGLEMWSWHTGGILNTKGEIISTSMRGVPANMACWWDGDLSRELLNGVEVIKYNPKRKRGELLFKPEGVASNNGTKRNPSLQGDIIGDWREEILARTEDGNNLRLYVSTIDTDYRFHTFLEDPIYRISIATQNVAYNQPTQPGFYFGSDLGKCFSEKELLIKENEITLDAGIRYDTYQWSTGGTAKTETISRSVIGTNNRTKIELEVTFRGFIFTDYLYVTFE